MSCSDKCEYSIVGTSTIHILLASLVPWIYLSHLESWCKLHRCIQTLWHDTLCHHKTHYIFPQNSHHTYLSRHSHSLSEIHCHATSIFSWLDLHAIHAFS